VSAAGASAAARSFGRDSLPVATVCALVVAGAVAGLLLGGVAGDRDLPAVRPAAEPQPVAHGGLRVQVPEGWTRAAAVSVPGFSRPLGLRNADASLSAVVERLPAASATLLPPALLNTARERPAEIRLDSGRRAWRYRLQRADGSLLVVYAAPTTGGVATVACASPAAAGVPRACDTLARTLAVPGWQPLEPGPGAAFFSLLPATVAELEAERAAGSTELAAATRAAAQAAAADGLAGAHRAAAAALSPLAGEPRQTAAAAALAATASAYTALARTASARAPRRYAVASRAVSAADARLRRAMAGVAAGASAATRAAPSPVRAPAAREWSGVDGAFVLLALLGACAIFLAAREAHDESTPG